MDTKEPVTAIDSHPPERTNLTTVGFTYSADEPSTFTCRLTGPGHETDEELACPAGGITYESLADGAYTFRVRAHDLAGNADDGSENFAFTVERALPDTPAFTLPADDPHQQTSTTVTLRGTGSDGSNVILEEKGQRLGEPIAVANGLWQRVLENVTPGAHTYDVHAENAAGTTVTVSRTVIIDVAPAIQAPAENALLGTAKFTVTGTANPATPITLLEGTDVRGTATPTAPAPGRSRSAPSRTARTPTSRAPTPAPSSAPRTVRVDTTAPETTIESGPGGITNDDTPTFTFGSDDPAATFECIVDEGDFVACPREFTTAPLTEGDHTLVVRAVDVAGNRDQTPVNRVVTVDKTAPARPPSPTPRPGSPRARPASCSRARRSRAPTCGSIDGGIFLDLARIADEGGGTWELPVNDLTEGTHVFTARAVDRAGNESPLSAAVSVIVDRTAPAAPTVTGGGLTNDNTPTFTFTSEAGATFTCALDSGDAGRLRIAADAADGRRRPAHADRRRVRRGRATRAPRRERGLHGRHGGARGVDHRRPGPADQRRHAVVHVHLARRHRDLPVRGRPGDARGVHLADRARRARGRAAHVPRRRPRPGRQRQRRGHAHLHRRHRGARRGVHQRAGRADQRRDADVRLHGRQRRGDRLLDRRHAGAGLRVAAHARGAGRRRAHVPRDRDRRRRERARDLPQRSPSTRWRRRRRSPSGPAEGQVLTTDSVRFDFTFSEPGATSLCRLSFNGEPLLQQGLCPSFSEPTCATATTCSRSSRPTPRATSASRRSAASRSPTAARRRSVTDGPTRTNDAHADVQVRRPGRLQVHVRGRRPLRPLAVHPHGRLHGPDRPRGAPRRRIHLPRHRP